MTDPITEIAGEMELQSAYCAKQPIGSPKRRDFSCYEVQRWAARILAHWTPERAEFMEAAIEWGDNSLKWGSHTSPDEARILRNEARYICVRMDAAYRAMIAAEKGESSK